MRGTRIALLLIVLGHANATAREPVTRMLWPGKAPGALGDREQDKPKLIVYRAPEATRATAVVVCPGGGYGGLALDHEGHQIARWLNSLGVTAFILDYRHRGKGYGHPAPLQDVQRSLRIVRAEAEDWKVDPSKIGVLGFSAGGHLASTAATHFDKGQADSADPIQRVSCRPDFAVLCYAVIALDEPYTHRGSQRNLLGNDADPDLIRHLSNEKQVTAETPPTFLWHTYEDRAVPVENSIHFLLAMRKAGVPAELHVFPRGRHGLGLAANTPGARKWPELCHQWMQAIGMLPE